MERRLTEEQKELAGENHNLIYSFCNLYNLPLDEYYGLCAIGLCNAASEYDGNLGAFSTFAYRCMMNEVRTWVRTQTRQMRTPTLPTVSLHSGDGSGIIDTIPSKFNLEAEVIGRIEGERVRGRLREKEKRIFDLRMDGFNQSEIARSMGCSSTYINSIVRDIRKKAERILAAS